MPKQVKKSAPPLTLLKKVSASCRACHTTQGSVRLRIYITTIKAWLYGLRVPGAQILRIDDRWWRGGMSHATKNAKQRHLGNS